MLYNIKEGKIQDITLCFYCPYFNKTDKKCEGLNTVCFEYDDTTKVIIDGTTGLPRRLK